MRRRAFTLVELLVVIGIISILIGILLPVTAKARAQGKMIACKGQLHDIGAAFQMYINQYKGHYPPAPTLPGATPDNLTRLQDYLNPFVGNSKRVFHCAADYGDGSVFDSVATVGSPAVNIDVQISYFYYAELGVRPIRQTFFFKVFKEPQKVPVLWDAGNFHGGSLPYNWLCADGHVEHFLDDADKARAQLPNPGP